jgi:hypothetical protein
MVELVSGMPAPQFGDKSLSAPLVTCLFKIRTFPEHWDGRAWCNARCVPGIWPYAGETSAHDNRDVTSTKTWHLWTVTFSSSGHTQTGTSADITVYIQEPNWYWFIATGFPRLWILTAVLWEPSFRTNIHPPSAGSILNSAAARSTNHKS